MSIRLKILFPMIAVALIAIALMATGTWLSARDAEQASATFDLAMRAAEQGRQAREAQRALDALVAEVSAMTDIVAPDVIEKRFSRLVTDLSDRLADLKRDALSPEASKLTDETATSFEGWRRDAAVLLGVERGETVVVATSSPVSATY